MTRQERSIKVEAVVLRHTDWGEADRILGIYTREAGKLRALVKGARKLQSRKAGHLEPFARVQLMLARGRDLWIVTQAETVNAYLPLREDLQRIAQASYVIELLDRFTYEEGPNRSMYSLLVDTLDRLADLREPFMAVRYYELHMLDLLGFRPELVNCVRCGGLIEPQDQFYSVLLGGILCPTCGPFELSARAISVQALKYLRHIQRSTFAATAKAQIPDPVRSEMETVLQNFMTFHLERNLNSPAFIREVRRLDENQA